ncbi:MAG: GDYXXLXY domain-containing protein [Planctomycetaceae bacterium]|nr:GDYXXLXY domain-containing protein [Planctomycetaceae bacterium]
MLDVPFKTDVPFKDAATQPFAAAEFTSAAESIWKLTRSREALWVIAFVGLQIAILLLMIVLDGLPLVLGERLRLKVVPVDPRDLFRGDYVVLDYGFNRLGQVGGIPHQDWHSSDLSGRDVYVSLRQEGGHYVAASASLTPPASGQYIRGTMDWPGHITCGIEAFYVEQGEGLRLEQSIRQGNLLAEVAVWQGKAKLVRLIE